MTFSLITKNINYRSYKIVRKTNALRKMTRRILKKKKSPPTSPFLNKNIMKYVISVISLSKMPFIAVPSHRSVHF